MSRFRLIRFMLQRYLWAMAFLVVLLGPTSARAQDQIVDKAYWTDVSGQASFEQAREASYTPYSGVLSKGFNSHTQWIRLRIAAVPPDGQDTLVLRIRPVYLDNITLYDPDAFGGKIDFLRQMDQLADSCLENPPRPGVSRVRLPGHAGLAARAAQLASGVRLHPSLLPALAPFADRFGLAAPAPLKA